MKSSVINAACLIMCTCLVHIASAQYRLTSSNRIITIDSRSGGKEDLRPASIGKGRTLDAGDYLLTKTETSITMETPKGTGEALLPAGMRMKVAAIATSSMFALYKHSSLWDIFVSARQAGEGNKRNAGVESGGTRVGVKEGGYSTIGGNMRPEDNARLAKINDSLSKSGVNDSLIYYLHDAMFLEQSNYTRAAKKDYKRAFNFAVKNQRDTAIVGMINRDFLDRTSPPASGGQAAPPKSKTDEFFK